MWWGGGFGEKQREFGGMALVGSDDVSEQVELLMSCGVWRKVGHRVKTKSDVNCGLFGQ